MLYLSQRQRNAVLVGQRVLLYNRAKGKQMNESPNEFFARLIAHNEVVKNNIEDELRKERNRQLAIEAIEKARTFA